MYDANVIYAEYHNNKITDPRLLLMVFLQSTPHFPKYGHAALIIYMYICEFCMQNTF
jgi:hypothetical protein